MVLFSKFTKTVLQAVTSSEIILRSAGACDGFRERPIPSSRFSRECQCKKEKAGSDRVTKEDVEEISEMIPVLPVET